MYVSEGLSLRRDLFIDRICFRLSSKAVLSYKNRLRLLFIYKTSMFIQVLKSLK